MLSSTFIVTCKCPQVFGIGRRMPRALSLQHNGKTATMIKLTRMISGSRPTASISSSKSNQRVNPPQPPPEMKAKWDLCVGLVLERKPQLTQEMTSIEKDYVDLLGKYEFELSKKSDHEVRKEKDKIISEKIKSGDLEASTQTAQDQEDLWAAEVQQFKFASRVTEADKANNQKSLDRARDSHLLLVTEQKYGNDYVWSCPHGKWTEGETMRQTADRILKEVCPEVKAKVLGNAPWGIYKYKYPKSSTEVSSVGAKVFFYKAQIVSGTITLPSKPSSKDSGIEIKDYLWLKRSELESKLQPLYHKTISEFLIDETN